MLKLVPKHLRVKEQKASNFFLNDRLGLVSSLSHSKLKRLRIDPRPTMLPVTLASGQPFQFSIFSHGEMSVTKSVVCLKDINSIAVVLFPVK